MSLENTEEPKVNKYVDFAGECRFCKQKFSISNQDLAYEKLSDPSLKNLLINKIKAHEANCQQNPSMQNLCMIASIVIRPRNAEIVYNYNESGNKIGVNRTETAATALEFSSMTSRYYNYEIQKPNYFGDTPKHKYKISHYKTFDRGTANLSFDEFGDTFGFGCFMNEYTIAEFAIVYRTMDELKSGLNKVVSKIQKRLKDIHTVFDVLVGDECNEVVKNLATKEQEEIQKAIELMNLTEKANQASAIANAKKCLMDVLPKDILNDSTDIEKEG